MLVFKLNVVPRCALYLFSRVQITHKDCEYRTLVVAAALIRTQTMIPISFHLCAHIYHLVGQLRINNQGGTTL